MKDKHFIDSHKVLTFIYVIILMIYFNRWENPTYGCILPYQKSAIKPLRLGMGI